MYCGYVLRNQPSILLFRKHVTLSIKAVYMLRQQVEFQKTKYTISIELLHYSFSPACTAISFTLNILNSTHEI